jgi:Sigma-70, region 4
VLVLRFGLDSGTPRTLQEVGSLMGFSRERARQIERDALAALRRPEVRARLEDLDLHATADPGPAAVVGDGDPDEQRPSGEQQRRGRRAQRPRPAGDDSRHGPAVDAVCRFIKFEAG